MDAGESSMDMTNFAIFFTASWILIITPGPDIIYVITRGVSQGRRAGIVSAIGVTLGILVHTIFAALGLAVILRTSALAFLAVKYTGAAYLVYLGIKSYRDKTSFDLTSEQAQARTRTIFIQGMLSNVLNPKVALFFLAFLPQFVNSDYGGVALQMLYLGLTFAFFCVIFLLFLGYFSGSLGLWLSRNQFLASKIRFITGSILIALGLRLAFIDRR